MEDILNSEISVKETVDRFKEDKLIQALEQGDEYAISMAVASKLGGTAEDYINNLPEVFTAMVGGTVESNRSGNIFKDIGKSFSDGRKLSHYYEAYGRETDETKRLEIGKSIGEMEKNRIRFGGLIDTVVYGFPELVGSSIVAPAEMTVKNIDEAVLGGTAAAALSRRLGSAIGSTPYGKIAIGTGLAVGSYLNFSRIEKGASLYELDQITDENGNRLPERTKQIAASLYGAVSGLIEFAGLENILVGSGTAVVRKKVTDLLVKLAGDKVKNKALKEAAEKGAKRTLKNIAVGAGVTAAGAVGETATEVTQDLLYNAIEATVKEISNNVDDTEFAHKTWDEIKDGLKETAYNTFLSVLPLSAIASPSAMRQFSRKQAPKLTREEAKAIYDDIVNGEPYNVAEKPEAEQTFADIDDTDTEDITVPEVERTESGRLRTDIPAGYDTESDGRASYLRYSSDGQEYAFVRYHEDGESLVIDGVDVASGYEGLAEEVVEEFTRQNAGTEIVWDTEEGSVSAGIKDSIIARNIDKPGALQRFRGSFADEGEAVAYISSKIPNLNRMQARVVTRLFRVVAEREGMSLDRFLQDRLELVYDENLGERGMLDHRAIDKVTKEGKALFYFGKKGDMSTVVHELFHFLVVTSKDTRELSEAVRNAATESTFKTWLENDGRIITASNGIGVERVLEELRTLSDNPNDWNPVQHEIMATLFETHMTTGKTYNNKLKEIFDAFARWVKKVYYWLKTDKALNDDIVRGFDKLFEADAEYQQIAEEEEAAASGKATTEQLKAESGFSNLPGPGETDIAYDYDIDGLLYQRDAKHVKIALSELDYFTEAERERITENLNKFKRTPWYWQAIESLLVRRDIRALMNGEEPTSDSKLMAEDKAVNVREACKGGLSEIFRYVNSHSFISNPEKPEFAINSSMLNCDPSAECAKFCYAARGNYVYTSSLLKSELVTMCIEKFPEESAEQVFFEYNRTLLKETGKALGIFDKGDISEHWIPFIEALNKKGIPLQIFSKRPEFLSRVNAEKNVIMLSIDKSNTELAEKYTDLPIAYVYQGTENDLEFLAENEERFKAHGGVILPVKIGKKLLSKDKIDLLPKWANKYCCPVDSGFAKLKTEDGKKDWSCHRCDANGGLGCFYHRVKRLSEITSEEEWNNEKKQIQEIFERVQRTNPEVARFLSAEFHSTNYDLWKSFFGEGEGRNAEEVGRDRKGESGVRKGLSGVESEDTLFQRDTAYLEAVNRGDMETAQRMVDEAAKAAGYTINAYHGTKDQFTVFERGHDNQYDSGFLGSGFYFTDKKESADDYSKWKKGREKDERVIKAVLRMENPLVIKDEKKPNLIAVQEALGLHLTDFGDYLVSPNKRISDAITAEAQRQGYDGIVRYSEFYDEYTYVVFDSNQAKAADPVTYDDNGNVVPLSERFNPANEDIRYQRAFHGTPHDFDKFDLKFINTGEGAQAFGWGLYFAQNEETARWYAKTLADNRKDEIVLLVDGKPMDAELFKFLHRRYGLHHFENVNTVEGKAYVKDMLESDIRELTRPLPRLEILSRNLQRIKDNPGLSIKAFLEGVPKEERYEFDLFVKYARKKAKGENRRATINDVAERLEDSVRILQMHRNKDLGIAEKLASIDVDKLSADVKKFRRNLYTVTIPDDDGTNYLYWDRPIGKEYAERINEGLRELFPTEPYIKVSEDQKGREVYRDLEEFIADKKVSKFFNSIGFVGIDYPAGSISGGGDGTKRNFVIFNDEDVIVDEHIRYQKQLPPLPDSEIVLEASTYDTLEDWLDSRFPEDEESRLLYEAAWHMAQLYNNNDDVPDGVKDVEIERFVERAKNLYENSRLPADFDRVSDDVFGIVSGQNPADIETVRRDMANNPELYKALMYDILLEDTDPESYIDEVFAPTREEKLELAGILGDRTELPEDEIDTVLNELRESVKALEKQVLEESARANEEFAKLPENEQKLRLAYKDWRASEKKAGAIIRRLEKSGEITAEQTDEAQTLLAKLNAISEYIKETEKSHKAEVKALGKAVKNRENTIIKFYKQRIAELTKAHKAAIRNTVALAKNAQKQIVADLKKSLSEEFKDKYDSTLESLREKLKTARKEAVALERLRERRKKLIKKILAPIPKSVSLDVAPKISELQDSVRKNRRKMNLEAIEKAYKLRKDLVAYGRAMRGAVVDERNREAESIREEISGTVRSSNKANWLEDFDLEVTKANNVLLYGAWNMSRLAQILDGGKKGAAYNVLVRELRDVLSEKSAQISRRTDGVNEKLKEIKLSAFEARPYKIELEDSKKPYTPTVADLAYFLLANKNEQNREALAGGNLVLPSEKEQMRRQAEEEVQKEAETNPLDFLGKNIDSVITARTNNKIRELGVSRFNQVLAVSIRHFSENPKQMELVHLIEEVLNRREDFERLSDAIKEEYNQGVEKVEYYLPIHRLILNGVPSAETVKADLLLRNYSISVDKGIVQERIKISPEHQQAVDTDLIRVFFEAIEKQESLIVVNPYVRKLNRIFINQSALPLKNLIRNTYGDPMNRAIENHINEIAGRYHTSRSSIAKAILWLSGQLHYAYLGLKPSSFILQMATSWGAFLSEVNPVQLAMGISLATFKPGEAKKFVFGKSEMMKNRVIDAIYADSEREMARQRGWKRKLLTLREATILHLKYADFLCVTGGWIACYDKKYTALVAEGKSEAEADRLAVRYADETVAETQPMSESTERAEWFKNTAELYPIMRFTNSLNVIWNNVTYDIPAAIRNKEYSRALGLASGYIISGLLLAIARGLFDEDEDPDKISDEIRKLFYAITSQAIQSAPLVGSIADSTAQGLLGLGWKKSFYNAFPFAEKLSEGIGRKDWKKILEALGLLAGVPVSASKEIKRAIEEKDPKQLLGNR